MNNTSVHFVHSCMLRRYLKNPALFTCSVAIHNFACVTAMFNCSLNSIACHMHSPSHLSLLLALLFYLSLFSLLLSLSHSLSFLFLYLFHYILSFIFVYFFINMRLVANLVNLLNIAYLLRVHGKFVIQ